VSCQCVRFVAQMVCKFSFEGSLNQARPLQNQPKDVTEKKVKKGSKIGRY
jgi:hypothetical protein